MSPRSQRASARSGANRIDSPPSSPKDQSPRYEGVKKRAMGAVNWIEMVTIHCKDHDGSEQDFIVHKAFVTHHSGFYRCAFNGYFLEGQTQVSNEEPISVEAYAIFVGWLYTQALQDSQGEMPSVKELINVWVLADMKIIPVLQNQVILALNDECARTEELPAELFSHVYQHTGVGSPLRKLFINICQGQLGKMDLDDQIPREMLVDIIKAGTETKSTKSTKINKEKLEKFFVPEELPVRRRALLPGGLPLGVQKFSAGGDDKSKACADILSAIKHSEQAGLQQNTIPDSDSSAISLSD